MATQATKLTLGGKERTLKYTLWAVGQVGDKLGIKVRLNRLTEDLMETALPPSTLSVLLWGALIHEDETLTPEQVGKWVDQDNAQEVFAGFFSLFGGRLSETTRRQMGEKLGIESESEVLTPT